MIVSAGGLPELKALKSYTAKLDKTHGNKALRYFKKADMQILREGLIS